MTWFHAKEDRPTPKEVYNWRLYLETAIIATGSILYATLLLSTSLSIRTGSDSKVDTALDMTLPLSALLLLGRASRRPLTLARAPPRTFPATSPLLSRLALSSAPSSATYVGRSIFTYFMSCLTNVVVTERVGRKWALQANVVVFLVGAILMVAASHQLSYICQSTLFSSLIFATRFYICALENN